MLLFVHFLLKQIDVYNVGGIIKISLVDDDDFLVVIYPSSMNRVS